MRAVVHMFFVWGPAAFRANLYWDLQKLHSSVKSCVGASDSSVISFRFAHGQLAQRFQISRRQNSLNSLQGFVRIAVSGASTPMLAVKWVAEWSVNRQGTCPGRTWSCAVASL